MAGRKKSSKAVPRRKMGHDRHKPSHSESAPNFTNSSLTGGTDIIEKLIAGTIFLKHAFKGGSQPHHRFVWCSEDLEYVHWGDLNKKKISGSMAVKDIVGVRVGNESETFAKLSTKDVDLKKCFSLEGRKRSLDLETVSQAERDTWVIAFSYLIKQQIGAECEMNIDGKEVDEQSRSKRSLIKSSDVNRKQLTPAVLNEEINVLTKRLRDADATIGRLEEALKSQRGAGACDVIDEAKMYAEISSLRDAAQESYKAMKSAESRKEHLEKENKLLKAEVASLRAVRNEAIPVEMRRELEELRTEVRIARIRDSLHQSLRREDFVARLDAQPVLDVPIKLLPHADPDHESSSDDDESEEDTDEEDLAAAAGRGGTGKMVLKSSSTKRLGATAALEAKDIARLEDLLGGGVSLLTDAPPSAPKVDPCVENPLSPSVMIRQATTKAKVLYNPDEAKKAKGQGIGDFTKTRRDEDAPVKADVHTIFESIMSEMMSATTEIKDKTEAFAVLEEITRGISSTQLSGDTFAALNWVAGLQTMVMVTVGDVWKDSPSIPSQPEIQIESKGDEKETKLPSDEANGKGFQAPVCFLINPDEITIVFQNKLNLCDTARLHAGAEPEMDMDDEELTAEERAVLRKDYENKLVWVKANAMLRKTVNFKKFKEHRDKESAALEDPDNHQAFLEQEHNRAVAEKLHGPNVNAIVTLIFDTQAALKLVQPARKLEVGSEVVEADLSATAVKSLVEIRRAKKRAAAAAKARPKTDAKELNDIRANERQQMEDLMKTANPKPTHWFLIHSKWLDQWKRFVAGGKRPGEISNWELLDPKGQPRDKLKMPRHYRAIQPEIWQFLFSAYGGGPILQRDKATIYE